jgi:Scramblase
MSYQGGYPQNNPQSYPQQPAPYGVPQQQAPQGYQQQAGPGPAPLFNSPVLVVNQKAKLVEVTNQYAVLDQNGNQLGSVTEVGQGAFKKALRIFTNYDQYLTHKLEVRDHTGTPVLMLTRPAKLMKSRVIVARPDGSEIGSIVQQNVIGKINFALLDPAGNQHGAIKAENWRAWNFAIVDHTGGEIARITKTWEGFAKAVFTTADNYVVHIHRALAEPLRSLVVASALTVDTALKQDDK